MGTVVKHVMHVGRGGRMVPSDMFSLRQENLTSSRCIPRVAAKNQKAVRERLQIEKKDKKLQNKAVDEVIEEDD